MAVVAEPKRVLIQSDGTPVGTRVFDQTGHPIQGCITKIEWSVEPDNFAKAILTFENVELDAPAVLVDPSSGEHAAEG